MTILFPPFDLFSAKDLRLNTQNEKRLRQRSEKQKMITNVKKKDPQKWKLTGVSYDP